MIAQKTVNCNRLRLMITITPCLVGDLQYTRFPQHTINKKHKRNVFFCQNF